MWLSLRGRFRLLPSAFGLIRSFLRWFQQERQALPLLQGVLAYVSLLRGEATRLAQAGGGLGLGGGGTLRVEVAQAGHSYPHGGPGLSTRGILNPPGASDKDCPPYLPAPWLRPYAIALNEACQKERFSMGWSMTLRLNASLSSN